MVTSGELLQYLKSVAFPASRDDIIRTARRTGAPESIRRALHALPPIAYYSPAEVLKMSGLGAASKVSP
jgi:Protein of unknown function (DUF2795)